MADRHVPSRSHSRDQLWGPDEGIVFGCAKPNARRLVESGNDFTWRPNHGIAFASRKHQTISSSSTRPEISLKAVHEKDLLSQHNLDSSCCQSDGRFRPNHTSDMVETESLSKLYPSKMSTMTKMTAKGKSNTGQQESSRGRDVISSLNRDNCIQTLDTASLKFLLQQGVSDLRPETMPPRPSVKSVGSSATFFPNKIFTRTQPLWQGMRTDIDCEGVSSIYKIPEEVKRKAMLASPDSVASYWQYDLYRGPNDEKVKLHYCKDKDQMESVSHLFLNCSVLGFDMEWSYNTRATADFRKNVSLIQLASPDRIALFHIALFPQGSIPDDFVSPTFRKIMESSDVTKVGVGIRADCKRLQKHLEVESHGLFELSHLYKLVRYSVSESWKVNKRLVSLAQQVEELLQLPLLKGQVRISDWSQSLKFDQMKYAASDSYAGLQVFFALEEQRKTLNPTPPRPQHAELNQPIQLADGRAIPTTEDPLDENLIAVNDRDVEGADHATISDNHEGSLDHESLASREVHTSQLGQQDPRVDLLTSEKSILLNAAEVWVHDFCQGRLPGQKLRAYKSQLRAYALWHGEKLSVADAARCLRQPPLQLPTVSAYILEAIRLEKLDYEPKRLKQVVKHLPDHILTYRYPRIMKALELTHSPNDMKGK